MLTALLAQLQRGDTRMTFRLDRLGRSLSHLVKTLEDLEARKIGFETLDGVSTKGATGKLVLHVLASVAQFERQLLTERTMAGLAAARAEGHPRVLQMYARAREHRADARQDRIDEIAWKLEAGDLDPNAARVLIDDRGDAQRRRSRGFPGRAQGTRQRK